MGVGFFFLFFLALGVLCTIWLPFLIHGIAKQRKGENGKGFITTACIWLAFWGVMVTVGGASSGTLFVLFTQVAIFLLTAWFPLLIWGAVLWLRKRTSGKWRTLVAGAWGLIAVSFMVYQSRGDPRWATQEFNPDTYTGAVATVEFPYTGEGNINLTVYPENGTPYRWHVPAVDTNRMVIPAGEYRSAYLSVQLEGGVSLGINFDSSFTVAQDEVFAFPGGFPLVASIDVYKRTGDELSLDFNLADSAGNRVTYRDREKKMGFEALSPDGEQFWRGDFEWG